MSNSTLKSSSFDEFLIAINDRDMAGYYVVPKPDVAARLTREIEQKTGLKSRNMAGESVTEVRRWVSAQPGHFITQTRIAVDGMCALLMRDGAKNFEVTFHNTQDSLNWGDKVLLAIRYDRANTAPTATAP